MRWIPAALDPSPDQAHDLLQRELSRAEYQPSLTERVLRWISSLFEQVTAAARAAGTPSPVVAVVLLVVLLALVALVLSRLQRSSAPASPAAEVFGDGRLGSGEHRALAEEALRAGRYAEALVEAVRALAAGLVERQLLPDQPGTTTREIADRAAALFPAEGEALAAAARGFEEALYADRPAGEPQARAALALEERVRHARPVDDAVTGPVLAVPR